MIDDEFEAPAASDPDSFAELLDKVASRLAEQADTVLILASSTADKQTVMFDSISGDQFAAARLAQLFLRREDSKRYESRSMDSGEGEDEDACAY